MKEIILTQGLVALVDDEDYKELNKFKWYAGKEGNTFYAKRWESKKMLRMHSVIMNAKHGEHIDHLNGNGLDNRKENLLIVTRRQNSQNLQNKQNKKTSKYPGVGWHKCSGKWRARMRIGDKELHLGLFDTDREAFERYKQECKNRGYPIHPKWENV